MSDSVQPHKRQPTRLPRPWDSPGKNTGVGCHFLLQCMKVKSESGVAQSCPTLSDPMDCSLPGSSVHGIFQARVLEWGASAFSGPYNRDPKRCACSFYRVGLQKKMAICEPGSRQCWCPDPGFQPPEASFCYLQSTQFMAFLSQEPRLTETSHPVRWRHINTTKIAELVTLFLEGKQLDTVENKPDIFLTRPEVNSEY